MYGVDNAFQMKKVIDKSKEKWNNYRNEHFKDVIEYVKETDTYVCKCMDSNCNLCKNKIYSISTHNYNNRRRLGYRAEDICVIKNPIGQYKGRSKLQDDVYDFIKSIYCGDIIYNTKDVLLEKCGKKIELDIYLPEINIAFEINGDFWHMNPNKYDKNDINDIIGLTAQELWERDSYKKAVCDEIGIILFFIWEDDWKQKTNDTKNKIKQIIENNEN